MEHVVGGYFYVLGMKAPKKDKSSQPRNLKTENISPAGREKSTGRQHQ